MWDLPGPGLELVSPALAGGFLTTAPPGKPKCVLFLIFKFHDFCGHPHPDPSKNSVLIYPGASCTAVPLVLIIPETHHVHNELIFFSLPSLASVFFGFSAPFGGIT